MLWWENEVLMLSSSIGFCILCSWDCFFFLFVVGYLFHLRKRNILLISINLHIGIFLIIYSLKNQRDFKNRKSLLLCECYFLLRRRHENNITLFLKLFIRNRTEKKAHFLLEISTFCNNLFYLYCMPITAPPSLICSQSVFINLFSDYPLSFSSEKGKLHLGTPNSETFSPHSIKHIFFHSGPTRQFS